MKTFESIRNREVRHVFQSTKLKKKIQGLELFLAPSLLTIGRILVVTPRKSGNAPQRNLIRRRLKSIFYELGYTKKPVNCIIIVRKEGIDLSFARLKEIMHDAMNSYEHIINHQISS